jgi:hypothetical protein
LNGERRLSARFEMVVDGLFQVQRMRDYVNAMDDGSGVVFGIRVTKNVYRH